MWEYWSQITFFFSALTTNVLCSTSNRGHTYTGPSDLTHLSHSTDTTAAGSISNSKNNSLCKRLLCNWSPNQTLDYVLQLLISNTYSRETVFNRISLPQRIGLKLYGKVQRCISTSNVHQCKWCPLIQLLFLNQRHAPISRINNYISILLSYLFYRKTVNQIISISSPWSNFFCTCITCIDQWRSIGFEGFFHQLSRNLCRHCFLELFKHV